MTIDLPLIWAGLIVFAIIAYVVLDGFDLGIGILFPFVRRDKDRDIIVNSVAPVWDGNETWLVLGGGGLMAAFPLAYAVVLPALYAPLIAMLLGLIFRGVAFEFRFKSRRRKHLWNLAFFGGSLVAAFTQGIVVGAFVQGIDMAGRAYAGGWWDWLTPFSLFTGVALVVGYAVLGVCWLIMKTTGELQEALYGLARPLGLALLVCVGIVSLWTPLLDETIASRWFAWPNIAYLSPVPVLVLLAAWFYELGLRHRLEAVPFLAALTVFLLSFAGLAISLYPFVIPPRVTIWEAAAPDATLWFLLIGAIVLLPLVLGYTAHAYWVFRGKVDEAGYH